MREPKWPTIYWLHVMNQDPLNRVGANSHCAFGRTILLIVMAFILLPVGCATRVPLEPHLYSSAIVVGLKSLRREDNPITATFAFTNVSSIPMWFDGETRRTPACCHGYQSQPLIDYDENGMLWGDTGIARFKLAPGEWSQFTVRVLESGGPFRGGVWLCPEEDNKTMNDLLYWSDFVSP
jgi:hypothetical protein